MENSNIKYTSESVKMSNSHINIDSSPNTNIDIRYTAPSHHDINTLQSTTEPHPQWYGIQLAKQQSWQEQRVFAHHQRVRSVSSKSPADNSTSNDDNSAIDDDDDEEGDTTESETPWRFSHLAKQFSKLEQECFANGFAKVKVNVQGLEERGNERPEWRFEDLARHWERLEQKAFAGNFRAR
ncbi:hypothetical protein KCU77_g7165, partial [Aureobasidium melanogenum]